MYRENAKVEEKMCYFERMAEVKEQFPGPVRRLLGLVLVVPLMIVSFALFFPYALVCWVLKGDVYMDVGWDHRWKGSPLLPGTGALLLLSAEFIKSRPIERKHYSLLRDDE